MFHGASGRSETLRPFLFKPAHRKGALPLGAESIRCRINVRHAAAQSASSSAAGIPSRIPLQTSARSSSIAIM
jgi:hypothetical protein